MRESPFLQSPVQVQDDTLPRRRISADEPRLRDWAVPPHARPTEKPRGRVVKAIARRGRVDGILNVDVTIRFRAPEKSPSHNFADRTLPLARLSHWHAKDRERCLSVYRTVGHRAHNAIGQDQGRRARL
jgi:hypothetical protein